MARMTEIFMPSETSKAARAFSDYRDMGPDRSLAKLCEKYGKTPSYIRQLERWSALYAWKKRTLTWDAEQTEDRRRIETARLTEDLKRKEQEQAEMNEFQAKTMRAVWMKSLGLFTRYMDQDEDAIKRYETLPPAVKVSAKPPRMRVTAHALTEIIRTGLETERLARGAVTEIIQSKTQISGEAGLPPVLEVRLDHTPPAAPIAPNDRDESALDEGENDEE